MLGYVARPALVGSLSLLLVIGCSQAPAAVGPRQEPTRVPAAGIAAQAAVQVATVSRGMAAPPTSYIGNVQAKQQVAIVPKVGGRIMKLHVDVGSAVKSGDTLIDLDRDASAAQVAQAEAGLAAAQAKLAGLEAGPRVEQVGQAEANLRATQARLDQLRAGPTKEQLEAAEASVRLAKNQLYLVQAAGDAALGSRLPTTYTQDQKEAQAGVAWEQIRIAEANLAQLKAGPTAEQLAQALAAVDAAAQQLALVRKPVTDHDLKAARAGVDQAKAAVDLTRVQLGEATIKAPFTGIVSQRLAAEGALVGPTGPVLMLLSREAEIVVNVEETSLGAVQAGGPATVTATAYPGQEFTARVSIIAPSLDVRSRTAAVRLAPTDVEGKLRDGMSVQVVFSSAGTGGSALVVPRGAVGQDDRGSFVFVVKDGKAQRRTVTPGPGSGDPVQVVDGLVEGEQVVTSGTTNLSDGQEVTIR